MSLTDQQLQGFRKRLLQLQQELGALQQTGAEAAQVVELDQTSVGRLSRMDALQSQAVAQASVRRREEMLRSITDALQRITAGEYGRCHACDELINPKRLDANPTALYCIQCASTME